MNLYNKYAKEFSKTRQNPWKGWDQIVEELKNLADSKSSDLNSSDLRILDLGCGNGRFLKYMATKDFKIESYLGVDNSNLLLKETENLIQTLEGENKLQKGYEMKLDLNKADWSKNITETFNLVTSFGLMHHIRPFEMRKTFLKNAFELVEDGGFLAVSYWQFGALARYDNKKTHSEINKGTKYSENDFILKFGNSKAERFCHFVNEEELKELEAGLGTTQGEEDSQLKSTKTFVNDGRENNENIYRIYFK